MLDGRFKDVASLVRRLEGNNGILMGGQGVSLFTNNIRFPPGVGLLPEYILLANKKILKRKKKMNVVVPSGPLTTLG